MKPMVMLAVQALFAVLGLRQLVRNVLPELGRTSHPALIMDVWGPLIVIGPMLFLSGRIREHVAGPGWLAIGGPLLAALLGAGLALVRRGVVDEPTPRSDFALLRAIGASAGAAALLLLLGAAHDLTLWIGQCAFAIGAVLLWINTPFDAAKDEHAKRPGDARVGLGMTAAAACSVVQGWAMLQADEKTRLAAGAMALVFAVIALGAAARIAGPMACLRMSLWSSAFGVFLGLGLISLTRMLPEAVSVLRTGGADPVRRVANGFGVLALEAASLLTVCAVILLISRLEARDTKLIGVLIVIGATALAIWRIVTISA